MAFDPFDSTSSTPSTSSANAQPASANPPTTPASPATATPGAPAPGAAGANDTQPGTQPGTPQDGQNPGPAGPIANRGQDPNAIGAGSIGLIPEVHPLVQKASVLHQTAIALAGGQRYTETIDSDGNRIRTPVKMTGRQIAMAIALEAISGSLTGLAAGRGRGAGAAGAAAFAQGAARRQAESDQQDQQAQKDFSNKAASIAGKAQLMEINSRTILNTAEAEKYGADALDRLIEANRASGVLDIDPGSLDNNGQAMTQDELLDAMKNGKISGTDQLGPVVGRVEVTNRDGSKRWEATHLVIRDPSTPVTLSQEAFDRYAEAGVPGYPKGTKVGAGVQVKLATIQHANEVLAAHSLSDFRLKDMRDTLAGNAFADKVPASIDFSKPGVETAMTRFQKYVSHSNAHGMDVYESLQAMGADKRDPKTGAMQPNLDAKYVDTVASAMGGWPVLEAVHNQLAADKKSATEFSIIDSEAKANAVMAAPKKFTQDQISSARNFLTLSQQQGARKAAEDARARAIAEGKDTEAMLKTGVNPITGVKLSLSNAPDSMLVDSKGRPVPQNMQTFYKPSQNERQTADTARQALAISADLRAAVQKNPNLVGPLLGNSKEGLAKLGFGTEQAQKFLDDISFLQSASTKVHTGRFSSEILKKMGNMIKPGMTAQQFVGGLNSIDEVMGRYAAEDRLITVGDYKAMQEAPAASSPGNGLTNLQVNPQTGQQIGWDGKKWVDASTGNAVK